MQKEAHGPTIALEDYFSLPFELGAFCHPIYFNTFYYSIVGVNLRPKLPFRHHVSKLEAWELVIPKELLALSMIPKKLSLINQYRFKSLYHIGILAGTTYFAPIQAASHKNVLGVLATALSHFDPDQIILRNHPVDPILACFDSYGIRSDNSSSALEFLLCCNLLVSRSFSSARIVWNASCKPGARIRKDTPSGMYRLGQPAGERSLPS